MIQKYLYNPKVQQQYDNQIPRVGNPMDQMFCICYLEEKKTILPLTALSYDVTINEGFTQVEILQVFTNTLNEVVEFCYIFSINQAAAFCKLEVEIKNQKYYGIIKEKKQAKQEYQQGLQQGKTMIYSDVDGQFPDIMKVKIGNVEPNVEIQVKLSYIEPLQCNFSKLWRIHLPSTVVPRYSLLNLKQKQFFASKYNIGEVQPKILNQKINVKFNMQQKITYLKSPTHQFELIGNTLKILDNYQQQRDFVLLFSNDLINQPSATITHTNNDQMQHKKYCVTLNYIPNFVNINCDDAYRSYQQNQQGDVVTQYIASQTQEQSIKYCFVFLLDRSGSMYSEIPSAIKSLKLFLRSLPQNCLFNVVSFGSMFESVFPKAVQYTQDTLQQAINQVECMKADLGGTEMLKPLTEIFKTTPKNISTNIFLITDGAVSPDPIINLVTQNCDKKPNRCYTLGIGFGSSKYLIERVAYAGNGKYHYVDTNDEDLSTKIIDLLNDSMTPFLENVQIKCNQENRLEMVVPANIQQIRPNKQFYQQFLFNSDLIGKVEIKFDGYDRNTNQEIQYQITLDPKDSVENEAFHKLAAKLEIDYVTDAIVNEKPNIIEILIKNKSIDFNYLVDISVSNQVLSRATAFICEAADLPDNLKQKVMEEVVHVKANQIKSLALAKEYHGKSAGCCGEGPSQNSSSQKSYQQPQKIKYVKSKLEQILEYFNADGSIRFDKNLLILLKLDKMDLSEFKGDIWVCILVLAILQNDFEKEQDEWILIFVKGIMQLKCRGVDYYEEKQKLMEILWKRTL